MEVAEPKVSRVRWNKSYRIIASRFPPIDLFERISKKEDWEILCELESITNPRVRDQIGEISLIPEDRRVFGSGSSYVMSPFAHLRESRFSDSSFGVYYSAKELSTAHMETISRMEKFYIATKEDMSLNDFRVLIGKIDNPFHDIRGDSEEFKPCYQLNDWSYGQKLGKRLKQKNSNGIVYSSVRDKNRGECVAAFWPDVVGIPKQGGHFRYSWNGDKIDKYYDFQKQEWFGLVLN